MKNDNYQGITKAERMAKIYKNIMLFVTVFVAVVSFIGGICICALVDVSTGVVYVFGGLIIAAIGIFGVFYAYQMTLTLLDVATDVKANRIKNESVPCVEVPEYNQINNRAYETSECFYLQYIERDAYLFIDVKEPSALKTTRSLLSAMRFQSEEEALKYADYKGLAMGEKWKVVKKQLIIAVE